MIGSVFITGSGIFVTPAIILRATDSVGVSLILWILGAVFGLCGLLVWLELGLSIPKFQPPEQALDPLIEGEGSFENVPRNGGEKNYVSSSFTHLVGQVLMSISWSTYTKTPVSGQLACTASSL